MVKYNEKITVTGIWELCHCVHKYMYQMNLCGISEQQ